MELVILSGIGAIAILAADFIGYAAALMFGQAATVRLPAIEPVPRTPPRICAVDEARAWKQAA